MMQNPAAELPPHYLVWTCAGIERGRGRPKFLCETARGNWSTDDAADLHANGCPTCGRPVKIWRQTADDIACLTDEEKTVIELANMLGVGAVLLPEHRGGARERRHRRWEYGREMQAILDAAAAADGFVTAVEGEALRLPAPIATPAERRDRRRSNAPRHAKRPKLRLAYSGDAPATSGDRRGSLSVVLA